jgi:hypothetical protein
VEYLNSSAPKTSNFRNKHDCFHNLDVSTSESARLSDDSEYLHTVNRK